MDDSEQENFFYTALAHGAVTLHINPNTEDELVQQLQSRISELESAIREYIKAYQTTRIEIAHDMVYRWPDGRTPYEIAKDKLFALAGE